MGAIEATCKDSPIQQGCPCRILPDGRSTSDIDDKTLVLVVTLVYGGHVLPDRVGNAILDYLQNR